MIVRRQFQFDSAHLLSGYKGKCKNLHGHTYTGDIEVKGQVRSESDMVVDYNDIKAVVDELDHAVLFAAQGFRDEREEDLLEWAEKHEMKYKIIRGGKSTAENMAYQIAEDISKLHATITDVKVWLHETPGSVAIGEWHCRG